MEEFLLIDRAFPLRTRFSLRTPDWSGGCRGSCRAFPLSSPARARRIPKVLGIDVAALAVERATSKLNGRALRCRFATQDFLATALPDGPFQFVFDRGCFHVFDEPEERAHFAARVAAILAPGGLWLSLIGSTEGPPREVGPPRRSAREVTLALESALEIVELRAAEFHVHGARAWFCLSRLRAIPAQLSTRHE